MLTLEAAKERYWIPVLTHVEDVSAVLASIRQILDDAPDPQASLRYRSLVKAAASWQESAGPWRSVFQQASALRDELLLGRIRFDTLLFVKR